MSKTSKEEKATIFVLTPTEFMLTQNETKNLGCLNNITDENKLYDSGRECKQCRCAPCQYKHWMTSDLMKRVIMFKIEGSLTMTFVLLKNGELYIHQRKDNEAPQANWLSLQWSRAMGNSFNIACSLHAIEPKSERCDVGNIFIEGNRIFLWDARRGNVEQMIPAMPQ